METQLQDLGRLKRSLSIEIPFEEVKPTYKRVLNQVKSTKMKGFRPGRFPKGWVQKRFTEHMQHEATSNMIPKYFSKAVGDMGLQLATRPTVEDLSFDEKKPFRCQLSFEIKPELPPPNFDRLEIKFSEAPISAEEIDTAIENFRENHATFVEKSEELAVEEGDTVVISSDRTIDGETASFKDQRFAVDEKIYQGIREQILGMKKGETKEFAFDVTKEYDPNFVGKTAEFKLTIDRIEQKILPELNEEFFQKVGSVETEVAFRQFAEEIVRNNKKEEQRQELHAQLKEQLLELYGGFELPEKIIEDEEKRFAEQFQKSDPEANDDQREKAADDHMKGFRKSLSIDYIIDNIAKLESLQPEEEEIQRRYLQMCQYYGANPEEFHGTEIGNYMFQQLLHQLSQEKVLDFTIDRLKGNAAS